MPRLLAIGFIVLSGAILVFVPALTGPAASCNSGNLCVPDQRQSITMHFFGIGGESSFGVWPMSTFYYFCFRYWCAEWFGP